MTPQENKRKNYFSAQLISMHAINKISTQLHVMFHNNIILPLVVHAKYNFLTNIISKVLFQQENIR